MKHNLGRFDRWLRAIIATTLLLAWTLGWLSGIWAVSVIAIVAVYTLLTAAFGYDPIYKFLHLHTNAQTKAKT